MVFSFNPHDSRGEGSKLQLHLFAVEGISRCRLARFCSNARALPSCKKLFCSMFEMDFLRFPSRQLLHYIDKILWSDTVGEPQVATRHIKFHTVGTHLPGINDNDAHIAMLLVPHSHILSHYNIG